MSMYDPPHPGEFIREVYLEGLEVSSRTVAAKLKVSPSTFTRLLNGKSSITPEMALRSLRPWVDHRKVGWQCKTVMIFGKFESVSMLTRSKSSSL